MKPKFYQADICLLIGCIVFFSVSCNQFKSASEQKDFLDASGIDSTVRPQDDFFHFVNGKWIKNTEIPAAEATWGTGSILYQQTTENIEIYA